MTGKPWTVIYWGTVRLCSGLARYAWGWSLGYPVVQWAGWLCIGMYFRLFGCITGLLILSGYAMGQVNLVRLHIRIARSLPGCIAGCSI